MTSDRRTRRAFAHPKRCHQPHCSDCRTRRGKNRGNRAARHTVKAALRAGIFDA